MIIRSTVSTRASRIDKRSFDCSIESFERLSSLAFKVLFYDCMMADETATKNKNEQRTSQKPLENLNSFLYKLWTLVNDDTLNVIRWSPDGEKIVINNPHKFTSKVLTSCERKVFKTKNISSFIRQLNLYGFRRVKETCGKTPIIFKHDFFKRGRPDLLVHIKRRKPLPIKPGSPSNATTPPKAHKRPLSQGQSQSSPRYQVLPVTHNYPYLNTSSLSRKNVHMPFVTPFAVNHGPTFINVGSNSTVFGKPTTRNPARVFMDESSQTTRSQIPTQSLDYQNLKRPSETPYNPWHYSGFHTPQGLGTPVAHSSHYNDRLYPVMKTSQSSYTNYPSGFLHRNVSSAMPRSTGYRNYGDTPDTISHPGLPRYNGPLNVMTSSPYHKPQVENLFGQMPFRSLEKVSDVMDENASASCSSGSANLKIVEVSGSYSGDGVRYEDMQKKKYSATEKLFSCLSVKEEKEFVEEEK